VTALTAKAAAAAAATTTPRSSKPHRKSASHLTGKRTTGRRSAGKAGNIGVGRSALVQPKSVQHVRKWFQVQRPPAPGITFSVRMWVPIDRLTSDEKKVLLFPTTSLAQEEGSIIATETETAANAATTTTTTTILAASEVELEDEVAVVGEEAFAFDFEADAQFELSTAPGDDLFAPPPLWRD
jgi:hypothetical protein